VAADGEFHLGTDQAPVSGGIARQRRIAVDPRVAGGLLRLLPDDSANDVEDPPEHVAGAAGDDAVVVAVGAANAPFSIGKITRREDALRAVNAAADYFEKYEPISPIGSALRDVDRRARMSFDDLLVELIPDGSSRELFYWRSGIRPPPE